MTDRSLFDVRYAFPGYVFIFFTLILSYGQIITRVGVENIRNYASLFGFIYLLSGAPLGYLISQAWYVSFYHLTKGYYYRDLQKKKERHYISKLSEKLAWKIEPDSHDTDNLNIMLDLILIEMKNGEEYKKYLSRRWDLYHVMAATEVAIIAGIIGGVVLKIYCGCDIYLPILLLWNGCITPNFDKITKVILIRDIVIIGFGVVSIIAFRVSKKRILYEHDIMLTHIIDIMKASDIENKLLHLEKEYFNTEDVEANERLTPENAEKIKWILYLFSFQPLIYSILFSEILHIRLNLGVCIIANIISIIGSTLGLVLIVRRKLLRKLIIIISFNIISVIGQLFLFFFTIN